MSERTIVGVRPWLPWPLSQWRWWTEPVRAERLAALRIGLAAVLLADLVFCYLPQLHTFYGPDSLTRAGNHDLFGWYVKAPPWNWSLLRGLGHPVNLVLSLAGGLITTVWVFLELGRRWQTGARAAPPRSLRWGLALWTAAAAAGLLGLWARLHDLPAEVTRETPEAGPLAALIFAGLAWLVATLFLFLEAWPRLRGPRPAAGRSALPGVLLAWAVATGFVLLALVRLGENPTGAPAGLSWALEKWDQDPQALSWAMGIWIAATVCLLAGLATPLSAVLVWVLSTSFANLNCYIDNAGDTIRGILLFYLMISPCGAAWSVDAWLARRRGRRDGPVFIYPWVLRLLLLQMIFVYFVNGLCKLIGPEWQEGLSLYYVMGDMTLTRVSFAEWHLPVVVLRATAYTVLAWEVSFPLLVSLRRTRTVALCFGALFHAGIWASMELGGFAPYALCMYLPLIPWERWLGRAADAR